MNINKKIKKFKIKFNIIYYLYIYIYISNMSIILTKNFYYIIIKKNIFDNKLF